MSQSYFLPCACGANCVVEARHAGGTVTCNECNAQLDVPKFRELRQLEPAAVASSSGRRTRSTGWSPIQGGLFVLGTLLLVIAGGSAAYTYVVRQQYDQPAPKIEDLNLPDMSTIELRSSWELWKSFQNSNVIDRPTPYFILYRKKVAQMDRWLQIFGGVAGVGALIAVASLLIRPGNNT